MTDTQKRKMREELKQSILDKYSHKTPRKSIAEMVHPPSSFLSYERKSNEFSSGNGLSISCGKAFHVYDDDRDLFCDVTVVERVADDSDVGVEGDIGETRVRAFKGKVELRIDADLFQRKDRQRIQRSRRVSTERPMHECSSDIDLIEVNRTGDEVKSAMRHTLSGGKKTRGSLNMLSGVWNLRPDDGTDKNDVFESDEITGLNHIFSGVAEKDNEDNPFEISPNELTFIKKIGYGRHSSVYSGKFRNQDVALKVLKSRSPSDIKGFSQELFVISNFKSPDMVFFYGVCFKPYSVFVLSLADKGSLYDVLQTEEISFEDMCYIAFQIARGLLSFHSWTPELVHRDIKTKNVLVYNRYTVKLCDFGDSQAVIGDLEEMGNACGTLLYLCPEVYLGEPFTPKSDIYAFGILLWELTNQHYTGKYAMPYSNLKKYHRDYQLLAAVF
eukprot:TRINITY_DN1986_c0_g1_i6.p1 TRINITY_DN1986_c0_g1~~TRINITY_DN1986_c0_g1_i6.p1  ORF type:complete len:443 (-),score=84.77 TRINITY_DN1986_c0_g1_i6:284-1612(-)